MDDNTEEPQSEPQIGGIGQTSIDFKFGETVSNMKHLTRLIKAMSKFSILVVVSVITTFVNYFICCIVWFVIFDEYSIIGMIIAAMLSCIDILINTICLILQFDFSKKYYKKICIKCHKKCENRYTQKTNKINKDTKLIRLQSGEFGIKKSNSIQIEDIEQKNNQINNEKFEPQMTQPVMSGTKSISVVGKQSFQTLDA